MVVNGLRKYEKGDVSVVENIKISMIILPFGQMKLTFSSTERRPEKKEMPVYIEPRSTNIEKIEIFYEGSKDYKIPETTDGR